MPLIPADDAEALREHFAKELVSPVFVSYFTRKTPAEGEPPCETCDETQQLLEELAALSPQIRLAVHDVDTDVAEARAMDVSRVPALVLTGAARGGVRYLGIPAGLEFSSLLADLVDVSRGGTDLAEPTKAALRALDRDVHIQVFVTPTCPFCPGAARLAHKMAIESPRVTADVVEASEFPDLVDRYNVHGVPKTVINETVEVMGAQPESRFLKAVLKAAA